VAHGNGRGADLPAVEPHLAQRAAGTGGGALHPDGSAVVGRPDPEWQEAVTAVVVLSPGVTEDAEALRSHCAEQLAGYEVPKSFVFVADLPRTASGKLMRSVLR